MSDDFDGRAMPGGNQGRPALEDSELLRRYVQGGSEAAFAELVRRRLGLVYSVALRQTRGDRHRAEDATQAVFADLARKAVSLAQRPVLAGWLYRSAQFAAAGLVRAEERREAREQVAHTLETIRANESAEPDWDKVRPLLDHALSEIGAPERDAILLRFYDGRPYAEIGRCLRLTESAARMRVERALDKLNAALAGRGITSTTAALGVALAHQAAAVLPSGLASSVAGAALASTTTAGGTWLAALGAVTKLQAGVAGAVVMVGAATYGLQAVKLGEVRQEITTLRAQEPDVAALRSENQRLASAAAEVELLRRDDLELKRLEQSVSAARQAGVEKARLARGRQSERESQRANEQGVAAVVERMNREGNALVGEYRALMDRAKLPGLTPGERTQAEADAKRTLAAIQAKQREVQAFIANASGTIAPPVKYYALTTDEHRAPAVNGEITAAGPGAERGRVSLRLPQVDPATVFSAIESIAGKKVIQDPSIAHVTGRVDVHTSPGTPEETVQTLRTALRDQLNIILEPTTDGNLLAKIAPPR